MRTKPFIHRMFLRWLKSERTRFVHPPIIVHSDYTSSHFIFQGISRAVRAVFVQNNQRYAELSVWVSWNGEHMDSLSNFELKLSRSIHGYECDLCDPEERVTFTSRSEALNDHIFEPFLAWCNKEFKECSFLEISGQMDSWTSAKLLKENIISNKCRIVIVPLQTTRKM